MRIRVAVFDQSPVAIFGAINLDPIKRFSDEINNNLDIVYLEEAQFVLAGANNVVMGEARTGLIRKSNAVLINREPERLEERGQRSFRPRAIEKRQVSILAGNWMVTGVITLPPRQPVETIIAPPSVGYRFLPVTSASAVYALNPQLVVRGGVVLLVNRAFISSILMHTDFDPINRQPQ